MNVLSLFDGISVGMQALKEIGIKVDNYFASEIEESSIKVSEANHPEIIRLGDVTKWKEWDLPKIDLVIGGSPCFAAGTKVITDSGYKNIEEIKIGDYVLTHENRFKKVVDFGCKVSGTISIKAQGALRTITTRNHPFYVKDKRESIPKFKKADEIKKGNYLAVNINTLSENPYHLDKETCWLLGRYIADGHYRKDKRKYRKESYIYQLIISVGKGKEELFESKIKNKHFSLYEHSKNVKRACFSSKELVDLVESLDIGKGAANKKISQKLLNLPIDLLKEVLDGYISGDCYQRKDGRIKFSTISEELAMSLTQATIKCYKTPCMLSVHIPSETKEIEGRIVKQSKIFEGYFYKDAESRRKSYFIEGDKMWLPFKGKEILEEKLVYNMTVEDDNTYTANNLVVHNCQGFSRQGQGLNFEDPRSKLFFDFVDIVNHQKEINADVKFMLENVDMKKEWEQVINEYTGVKGLHINSDLFLPHNRPRTYWSNIDYEIPKQKEYSLLEILEDINLNEYTLVDGIKVSNEYSDESKNLIYFEEGELRIKQATKSGYAIAHVGDGINISFPTSKTRRGRVVKNRSSCLDTSCDIGVFDKRLQVRKFTRTELERLQGLPDGYTDSVSFSEAKKMLGNGWTVPVISHILGGLK